MPHPGRSIASALPQALSPRTLWARGRAGQGLVVGVDGATGSGKTTLAAAVLRGLDQVGARTALLAVEDHVPGWDALAHGVHRCARALSDLDRGCPTVLSRWDWERMAPGGTTRLEPLGDRVLVVEGCGALAALAQPFRHLDVLRVLVSAPEDLRHARLARRDSYSWDVAAWEEQERQVAQAWRDSPGLGPDLVLPTGAQGLASAGPPTGPAPA